jgi:DNA segregation ATPase FtsK/SpoIIIE, S-DNA-T family
VRTINGTKADDLVYGQGLTSRQRWVIPLWLSTLGIFCKATGRGIRWVLVHGPITLPPLAAVVAVARYGWLPVALVLTILVAVLEGWWFGHRPSAAWVLSPVGSMVLGSWRAVTVYRRLWRAGMLGAGLAATSPQGGDLLPTLRRVRSTRWVDTVTVRLLHGQTPDQFAHAGEQLRHTFAAHRCTTREIRPGLVQCRFYSRDPLTGTVPPFPIPASTAGLSLKALPVGLCEDGTVFTLRLEGRHVLFVGESGAGKSEAIWASLAALVPFIRDGSVQVWAIDPKGGMELVFGRPLFTRYEDTSLEGMACLLEDAVAGMDDRTQRLKGVTRQHTPTVADPYVIVLVDEVASLTAYCPDKLLRRRIETALNLLLSKGRAPGYSVVAAVQDPRKDVLAFRDLIPTRVGLRMAEPEQVAMTLSESARERGARCDEIPLDLPGVAYVIREEHPAPVRVRFTHITDDDIHAMTRLIDHQDDTRPEDDQQGRAA